MAHTVLIPLLVEPTHWALLVVHIKDRRVVLLDSSRKDEDDDDSSRVRRMPRRDA